MLYGVQAAAQEIFASLPQMIDAVQFDNSSVSSGLIKDSQTVVDSPFLTVSMWAKFAVPGGSQLITSFDNYSSFIGYGGIHATDLYCASVDSAGSKYFQFGSVDGIVINIASSWNHIFCSVDTNHASGAKLKNLLWNGTSIIDESSTVDEDIAFDIGFSGKAFGLPGSSDNLGGGEIISFADVWIAPGVYLTASDVTKFRSASGRAIDLGANGEIPTGSPPAYYFHGNASSFATNLGSGGAVTLVGSLTSVAGPVSA